MATEKSDDKTVPTLVDVVAPGNMKAEGPPQPGITPSAHTTAQHTPNIENSPPRAILKAKIEALVAEIMVRHMDNARKEIIRRVLSEIDAYAGPADEK